MRDVADAQFPCLDYYCSLFCLADVLQSEDSNIQTVDCIQLYKAVDSVKAQIVFQSGL